MRAVIFLVYVFVANLGISATWFIPLLIITKLIVVTGLMPAQFAALVAIVVMEFVALIQFVVSFSKFGDRLLTKIAEIFELIILRAFLPSTRILGLPAAVKITDQFESFNSHISSVPCAPPRVPLA